MILGGLAIVVTALALVFSGEVFLIPESEPKKGWGLAAGIAAVGICSRQVSLKVDLSSY